MIDWDKVDEIIFNDPLLADVTAPPHRPTSSDKLLGGFRQILDFREANGRLPEDTPGETELFHMLQGILKSEQKIERCRPYDNLGILPSEQTEAEQLESIFNDPLLADVGDDDLFDVPDYMRERLKSRREADYVGRNVPCNDFDKYAEGFKEVHAGLSAGKYRLVKFSVPFLKVGRYFVDDGMIGYLAAFDDERVDRYGVRDGRTRVIYENGTESDIKFKTITKNLSVTGYSIVDSTEMSTAELERHFSVTENDVQSGTIYVLRSKSTRPEIASIPDLYKIGFTVTSVESRIANAANEPTYLCAPVEVVATWKVYNVKSSTFEALVHRLFSSVRLQVMVDGHEPKEWFIVPLRVIEQAVGYIISGVPVRYDRDLQQLVLPDTK